MMNNKGFTLVEMLLSFVIVSVIAGIMMDVLFNLKERSEKSSTLTQITIDAANITKTINNDLKRKKLTGIDTCISGSEDCYVFTFYDSTTKELSVNKNANTITYGGVIKELDEGAQVGSEITITNTYIGTVPSGKNSVLKILIPITNTYNSNTYSIEIVFQFVAAEVTVSL